jgi:peptide/nickel transport system permease protein
MGIFARFALARLLSALVTAVGVSLVVFLAMHALPGNFAEVLVPRGTPELRQRIMEQFGLDQPVTVQYFRWLWSMAQGDFGVSLITQKPIWHEFALRIPVTAEVAGLAAAIAIVIGIPLGVISGLPTRRRLIPTTSRLIGGLAISVPDFVIGSIFLYIFSTYSLGLRVGSWTYFTDDPVENLKSALLPALTLAALGVGFILTTSRHAAIGVLSQGFIMAAVARGKAPRAIVRQHLLRNIGIPVVTVVAIYLGYLLGGAIIVEQLYSIPGLGRFLIQSVLNRDYPVVEAGVFMVAAFFIALNMMADVIYAWLDPRISARSA